MNELLYWVSLCFDDCYQLCASGQTFGVKASRLVGYARMLLKFFLNPFFRFKSGQFGPHRLQSDDFRSLFFLYREIQMRQEYFLKNRDGDPVIFDCGANIGAATHYFKSLYPKASIQAFEPDPQAFAMLQKNVSQNQLQGVEIHECAVSDRDGELTFYVGDGLPGQLHMSVHRSRIGGKDITVQGKRLSDLIGDQEISLLKMDIEGAEYEVLPDLDQADKFKQIKCLILELHHNLPNEDPRLGDILSLLERNHYQYQITVPNKRPTKVGDFQDTLIHAIRRTRVVRESPVDSVPTMIERG